MYMIYAVSYQMTVHLSLYLSTISLTSMFILKAHNIFSQTFSISYVTSFVIIFISEPMDMIFYELIMGLLIEMHN